MFSVYLSLYSGEVFGLVIWRMNFCLDCDIGIFFWIRSFKLSLFLIICI